MGYKNRHGIFINYKRSHKHLVGRIYDYFYIRGLNPFMDEHSMNQVEDYRDELMQEIIATPFFLCILTKDGLDDLLDPKREGNIYYKEVETACLENKKILMINVDNIKLENYALPNDIEKIKYINRYVLPAESMLFYSFMDNLFENDILKNDEIIEDVLNWREYSFSKSNTLISSREKLEKNTASLVNRFGKEFVECVRNKIPFTGEYRIEEINMICYAASLIVAPEKNMVDRKAYDFGQMFDIFAYLLEDKDFSLRIITTAPQSAAANDAIEYDKLGNSALEDDEESIFLGSYARMNKLKEAEPYKTAFESTRFKFMVTDCALPYSLFQVIYKNGWEEFDHIKVDLYSYGIDSSMDRRSMMIFKKTDPENYAFFENQIQKMKNRDGRKRSDKLIRENNNEWIERWKEKTIDGVNV